MLSYDLTAYYIMLNCKSCFKRSYVPIFCTKQIWIDEDAHLRVVSFIPEVCIGKYYICAPLKALTAHWLDVCIVWLIVGQTSLNFLTIFDTPFKVLYTYAYFIQWSLGTVLNPEKEVLAQKPG